MKITRSSVKLILFAFFILLNYVNVQAQEIEPINLVILVDRSPSFIESVSNPETTLAELMEFLVRIERAVGRPIQVAGANFGKELGATKTFTNIADVDGITFLPSETIAGTSFVQPLDFALQQFDAVSQQGLNLVVFITDGSPRSPFDGVELSNQQIEDEFETIQAGQVANNTQILLLALSGLNSDSYRWQSIIGQDNFVSDLDDLNSELTRFLFRNVGVDIDARPWLIDLNFETIDPSTVEMTVRVENEELLPRGYSPNITAAQLGIGNEVMRKSDDGTFRFRVDMSSIDSETLESISISVNIDTELVTGIPWQNELASAILLTQSGKSEMEASAPTGTPSSIPESSNTITPIPEPTDNENESTAISNLSESEALLLLLERAQLISGIVIAIVTGLVTSGVYYILSQGKEEQRAHDFGEMKGQLSQLILTSVPNIDSKVSKLQPVPKSVGDLVELTRQLPDLYYSTSQMALRLSDTPTSKDNTEIIRILERLNPERNDQLFKRIDDLQNLIRRERDDISHVIRKMRDNLSEQTQEALKKVIQNIPDSVTTKEEWSKYVVISVSNAIQTTLSEQSDSIQAQLGDGLKNVEKKVEALQDQQEMLSIDVNDVLEKHKTMFYQVLLHEYRERYAAQLIANAEPLVIAEAIRLRNASLENFNEYRAVSQRKNVDPDEYLTGVSSEKLYSLARQAVNLLSLDDIVEIVTDDGFLEQFTRSSIAKFIEYAVAELAIIQSNVEQELIADTEDTIDAA